MIFIETIIFSEKNVVSVVLKLDGVSGRGITGRLTMDQKSRPTKMSLFHKNESPDTCYLTIPVFPAKTDVYNRHLV